MKARFQLENPKAAEATLSVTMPIASWERFVDEMAASPKSSSHPMWEFQNLVNELIKQAKEHFERETERQP